MKKAIPLILAGLFLTGCSEPSSNDSENPNSNPAQIGSVNQDNLKAFLKSKLGSAGDPMTYYDEESETTYIYYLLNESTQLGNGQHPIALFTTKDFIHYEDKGVVLNYEGFDQQDNLLGTGSVIKGNDGKYHFFYIGWNDKHSSTIQYTEKIQHAISSDLIHWTKKPEYGFYGGANDFRDPFVYKEGDKYSMLVTTNKGTPTIDKWISTDLIHFSYDSVFFNGTNSFNMECPTFVSFNGYDYLSFSVQASEKSTERVTKYYYKKSGTTEWKDPDQDLNWNGFYAGKILIKDNEMYLTGWIADHDNNQDSGDLIWGGKLVSLSLTQNGDGTLFVTPLEELETALSTPVEHKELRESKQGNKNRYKIFDGFSSTSNATKVTFKFTPSGEGVEGLSFGVEDKKSEGYSTLFIDIKEQKIYFSGEGYSVGKEKALIQTDMNLTQGKTYECELIVQEGAFVFSIDGVKTVSAISNSLSASNTGFGYFTSASSTFEDFVFFE